MSFKVINVQSLKACRAVIVTVSKKPMPICKR